MNKFYFAHWIANVCIVSVCAVGTVIAAPISNVATLETQVQRITEELRCLVCQNQSIADSHAELAVQLKNQVRSQLQQGKSESQVKEFMVQRYGDFVLYRPPVKTSTWLLWFGPAILFLLASLVLGRQYRRAHQRWQVEAQNDSNDSDSENAEDTEGHELANKNKII
ncbi:cytochrome c-type biogenesis protein [Undibacterium flavidum]|uniref:Cytochrome c-type biogenesis protein n=1 Tax=Undibacterium flavidum TaxID=2762297 RepID=A0ABR6Y973_9BURK|nr:cytochrome c-type biogenesis protein [Undibacterium flavidum]MBC3873176.1 cytochrome c-type biogenesis protein CcmH [Undibacterium flavidum]